MTRKLSSCKTENIILRNIIDQEKYKELKKILMKKCTKYTFIKKLALDYIENILQLELFIKQTKEDFEFLSDKDINELIFEYNCKLIAFKECLYECINIIELKKTLKDCNIKINSRINDCEYDLYPGFLCSQKSIQEASILHSILKDFKEKITCSE